MEVSNMTYQNPALKRAPIPGGHGSPAPLSRFVLMWAVGLAALLPVSAAPSIARTWDEEILTAIRIDKPHPPVHARNLFTLSVAMYDVWAAYDNTAVGYVYRGKHTAADVDAARREAISYAAYRILYERYSLSKSAATTLPALDARLATLGYNKGNTTLDTSTPAGVGNTVAAAVSAWFINDGARQLQGYKDALPQDGGYAAVNDYLNTGLSGVDLVDVNHWAPLEIADAVDQNGLPTGPLQVFLGSQWLGVRPFALNRSDATTPWIDPGPPPLLGTATSEEFRANVVEDIRRSSQLTPDDGVTIDLSPGVFGNNTLGANDGTGHPVNPATGQPYPPNVVKRGDYARCLTEFFADGPTSETPPGHWNTLANGVSDFPGFVKRIGGTGPVVSDLEWDVKVYFAVNAAVHDAACAAWSLKRKYDGWRPIAAIRYMGQSGQSSDPGLPSFSTNGLPLIPDLIELVTTQTAQDGGRHAGLTPGKIALYCYPGPPSSPGNQHSGVKWIHAEDWTTYQKKNFVSPAFPGYISGHSTFSRSAAEVLTAITGSPFFPGGLGTYDIPANGLGTEQGPSAPVRLQWATYYDAADQAGISRLWGGIHPPVDDFSGRRAGSQCGQQAYALARLYFDGSIALAKTTLGVARPAPTGTELRFGTFRGLYYKLQSAGDLGQPFADEPGGFTQAFDGSMLRTDGVTGPAKFYRVVSSLTP